MQVWLPRSLAPRKVGQLSNWMRIKSNNREASVTDLIAKSRQRHLSSQEGEVAKVIATLAQAPEELPSRHACRLEVRTYGGNVLRAMAEDVRLDHAIDKAFKHANQLLDESQAIQRAIA